MNSPLMQKVVVLGTGGTIAGLRDDPNDPHSYQAAQVGVEDLVCNSASKDRLVLETHQIAQIDSKDMGLSVWIELLLALQESQEREEVMGILITHGTDTLEETAFLLSRLVIVNKPIVLTGAMKPADAPHPDGPKNIEDALEVIEVLAQARSPCVCVVAHGVVHSPYSVQKLNLQSDAPFYSQSPVLEGHPSNPFSARSLSVQALALSQKLNSPSAPFDVMDWRAAPSLSHFCALKTLPRVEIVMSHSGMQEHNLVRTLCTEFKHMFVHSPQSPGLLKGLVLVGPGAGNLHLSLHEPIGEMLQLGVRMVVTQRAPWGEGFKRIGLKFKPVDQFTGAQSVEQMLQLDMSGLSPVKARIAMMLELMDS